MDGKNGLHEDVTMKVCTLCDELQGDSSTAVSMSYAAIIESGQSRLASSRSFSVVPSLGALNESHVMVVPFEPLTCLANLTDSAWVALITLQSSLRQFCRVEHDWTLILFEHGAGSGADTSGACVEHAHLHVIRALGDFRSALAEVAPLVQLPQAASLRQLANTASGYVCLWDLDESVWIANDPGLPPQYFRFLYSRLSGNPAVWNWHSDPRFKKVEAVIRAYDHFRVPREIATSHAPPVDPKNTSI